MLQVSNGVPVGAICLRSRVLSLIFASFKMEILRSVTYSNAEVFLVDVQHLLFLVLYFG